MEDTPSVLFERELGTEERHRGLLYEAISGLPLADQQRAVELARRLYAKGVPMDTESMGIRQSFHKDVKGFAQHFFPHLCTHEFCEMHEDFFDRWEKTAGKRGLREDTAAPRGYAKTTLRGMIKLVHDCVYRHERFILVISSRFDMAVDKVEEVRDALETNEELIRRFGPQKSKTWNKGSFITRGGVVVRAASPRSQVRGMNWRGIRPTKIVLDDAENSEHVNTEAQREKFVRWFMSDISKLGTVNTNIEVIGTILHPESLVAQLLENPGWNPSRYKAIISYADEYPELWQEWRDIYVNPDAPRMEAQEAALQFFESHKEDMLRGSRVLWPQRETYYDLMVMILTEGSTAFELEKQNNPMIPEMYPFDMDDAGYFTLEIDRLRKPKNQQVLLTDIIDICAYWDPALGAKEGEPDWAACAIVGKDTRGYFYILDAYMSQRDDPTKQTKNVARLITQWHANKVGLEVNNFQSLLVSDLKEEIARCQLEEGEYWDLAWYRVNNMRNKVLRIMTLEPYVSNRWLWFNARLHPEAQRQMRFFVPIPNAGKDDFPDSVEGAVRVLRGLIDRTSVP